MGNDGGSIPTRRELVKEAARALNTSELKATKQEAQGHAWSYCPISNRPLATPIVSDCAGTLYNKDAILEQLLPKDSDVPASVIKEKEDVLQGRVKGLRDIVEVKFTLSPDKEEKKLCPITSKELGPTTKSVYLIPCGHAFSEVAIREVAGEICVECNEPYKAEDIITILPSSKEDVERLAARANRLKASGLTHSLKKAPGAKKRKKNAEALESTQSSMEELKDPKPKHKITKNVTSKARSGASTPFPTGATNGIKNAATASLTARVLDEQEESNKRRKLGLNDNLKSLFSSGGYSAQAQKSGDFMTRGFSLPKKST